MKLERVSDIKVDVKLQLPDASLFLTNLCILLGIGGLSMEFVQSEFQPLVTPVLIAAASYGTVVGYIHSSKESHS